MLQGRLHLLLLLLGEAAYTACHLVFLPHLVRGGLALHGRTGGLLLEAALATIVGLEATAGPLVCPLVRRLDFDLFVHRLGLGQREVESFAALPKMHRILLPTRLQICR